MSEEESARNFLEGMDRAVDDCDIALFSLYMGNVFSSSERGFDKGNITQFEMNALKETATYKITSFIKN